MDDCLPGQFRLGFRLAVGMVQGAGAPDDAENVLEMTGVTFQDRIADDPGFFR